MIGTISPLVEEARGQWWRSTALYMAGSIAGGAFLLGLVGAVGLLTVSLLPVGVRWSIAGLISLVMAAREFGFVGLSLPTLHRSVPRAWWMRWGPSRAALAYGTVLGMGATTVIPLGSFYVVVGWALLTANPAYGVVLGASYGVARALPVVAVSAAVVVRKSLQNPRVTVAELADRLNRHEPVAYSINGIAEVLFSAAMFSAVAMRAWQ